MEALENEDFQIHCSLLCLYSRELGAVGPHTLLGTGHSLGPLCFLLFFAA